MIRGIVVLLLFSLNLFAQTFQQKPMLGSQINWAHPLTRGLIGMWIFNEGSGDKISDLSGNENHGTLTNMEPEDWVGSTRGGALSFGGMDDYVNVGSGIKWSANMPKSVFLWFKTASNGRTLIHGTGNAIYLYIDTTNRLESWMNNTGFDFGGILTDDVWHHLGWVYDGMAESAYLDGVKLGNSNTETSPSTTGVTNIGRYTGNLEYFLGLIVDVRIYNRALSANEVEQLYRNSYAMFIQPNPMFMLAQVAPTPAARRRVIVIQ